MFAKMPLSLMAKDLRRAVRRFASEPTVEAAVLSSVDGIALQEQDVVDMKLSAVAGFLSAAAKQAGAMLGIGASHEIVLYQKDGRFVVSHLFTAGDVELMLVVLFKDETDYRAKINHIIETIRQIVEA